MLYRKITILIVLVLAFVLLPDVLFAQNQTSAFAEGAGFAAPRDPRGIAALLINSVFSGLGIVIICFITWGGYLVMTGGGEQDRIARGKRVIWTSTVGAIVLLSSYGISRYVIFIADYAANDQPDITTKDGFSLDVEVTPNYNRPEDPYFDPNATGHENDLVDPDFYRR